LAPGNSRGSIAIVIPAFNEAPTIAALVTRVRAAVPEADLVVVDDGSRDETPRILDELGVVTVRHACNLGYGRAIQTALKYAIRHRYDALVTIDADGQHQPEQLPGLIAEFERGGYDLLVGSRYVAGRSYRAAPIGRRIGMLVFSLLVGLVTGQRIFDTTSGLKAIRARALEPLARWHFVDFHAEAIVYLMRLGYKVGEHPVTVAEREHGESMYGVLSSLKYPAKTLLMFVLGLTQAAVARRAGPR
jgi:glycosyltransferase involved in cell wall biosynthesis